MALMLWNISFLLLRFAILVGRRASTMDAGERHAIRQPLRRLLISAVLSTGPFCRVIKGARVTSSLGTALTPLIGRERELRALESRLASGARMITLTGPGGSGKTTLAREVLGRLQGQGTEAYFVDLVGVGDPGLVPAEIATELGVTETAERDAAEGGL